MGRAMNNNETLATDCLNGIRELILSGELFPGERLKGEYLKQKFNVGLSPIREALFKLSATPLVEFRDKIGFNVAVLSAAKVYDMVKTHAKIECLLLRESIESGDDEWEASIMAALYKLSKVEMGDTKVVYTTWALRNDEFHNALVSACKIDGLRQVRNDCLLLKEWYTRLADKEIAKRLIIASHHEHAKIAELAIARKADAACAKLYKHTTTDIAGLVEKLITNNYILKK